MKSNCHRVFLRQFEMAQETGTCMRAYKVRITAARQTHFPLVIPPLKPSILDSTAVTGGKKKTEHSVAQKITCKSHFVKIVLKNMVSMIAFPKAKTPNFYFYYTGIWFQSKNGGQRGGGGGGRE